MHMCADVPSPTAHACWCFWCFWCFWLQLLQELEDQNRQLEAEVGELRELRDQEGFSGDVKELELELKVGAVCVSRCCRLLGDLQVCACVKQSPSHTRGHSLAPAADDQQAQLQQQWRLSYILTRLGAHVHNMTHMQELRQTLDEERRANDQLITQTDRDRAKIDDLEGR